MYSTKAAAEGSAPPGKRMSRAEAARHAALVRWKKKNPTAANVQERLAQIRAARLKKGKGKGKGAKPKAAKQTPEQRKQAKEAEAAQNRAKTFSDVGLQEDAVGALDDLASGRGTDDDGGLVKMGLAEQGDDGAIRLTAAGRAVHRAAGRGDAAAVRDAISKGKERTAKRAAQQQKKAQRDQEKAERAKARRSKRKARQKKAKPKPAPIERAEEREIPTRLPSPADRGTGPRKPAPTRLERKMITDLVTDLETLRDELLEDDAVKAGRRNNTIDQGAIDRGYAMAEELCDLFAALGADTGEEEEEAAEYEGEEGMEGKAERFGGKPRDDLDDSDFAGPNRSYPIMTAKDVKDAANLIGKADDPDAVKRKIIAIAKRKGFADALPEAWKEETKKSLDDAFVLGDAVKALDGGGIGAYAVRFGSEDEPDMSVMKDYFTKATDYWLDAWDRRPMLYHHTMDEDTQDAPRIGTWTKAEIKDEGVWLEGQLDKHHRYYSAIKELVRRGVLRLSSDSAPHLVRRATKADGIHEVTRWPIIGASLTPTPAEPRLQAASFKALLAEYGIDDTDNREADDAAERERLDAAKALEDRQRRLLLECELELAEATIT